MPNSTKREGKEEGLHEGERRNMPAAIQQLIADTDFDNEQIVLLTDGPREQVQSEDRVIFVVLFRI